MKSNRRKKGNKVRRTKLQPPKGRGPKVANRSSVSSDRARLAAARRAKEPREGNRVGRIYAHLANGVACLLLLASAACTLDEAWLTQVALHAGNPIFAVEGAVLGSVSTGVIFVLANIIHRLR
jgi:hypothetical protein